MSRFAHKAVSIGTALAMAMSLVGSAFAEDPTPSVASTTQSAANVAQVVQTGSVSSGDAVAFPGAKATTGNVKVEATVEVSQKIDQDADTSETGGSVANTVQAASNTANVSQGLFAGSATGRGSGDAVAEGSGAQASTGDVYVTAEVKKHQKIEQEADTEASALTSTATGLASTAQEATNTDIVLQAVRAQSGDAVASGPWTKATTGDVYAEAKVKDSQRIEQNGGRRGGESETEGGLAAVVQFANQTANTQQGLWAVSGDAAASVEDEEADSLSILGRFPFFCGLAVAESGDVYAEAEIEQEQKIEQDADAFAALFDEEDGTEPAVAIITQAAFNTAIAGQFAMVFSGDAAAIVTFDEESDAVAEKSSNHSFWGTKATTGDVYVEFDIDVDQDIDQKADATAIGPGAIANVDQDVDADAANYSAAIQGSTNGVFSIFVHSGDAAAFGAGWEGSSAESGDVGTWCRGIEIEIEIEQEIEQEADTFAGSGVCCL